jgi:ubiquinone/menaquinone biosynthesis C-methylase UbiE
MESAHSGVTRVLLDRPPALARHLSAGNPCEYDRLAPSYDQRWRGYVDATLEAVVRSVHFQGYERVLDLACGTGELERLLLTRWPDLQITGVDLSAGMLRQASAKLKDASALWVLAEATHLPFPDGTFDYAICASSFHYFSEPLQALQEIRRVLHPGGRLILVDWCDDYLSCKLCGLWLRLTNRAFCKTYSLRTCKALLNRSGFEVIQADRFRVQWVLGMMRLLCRRRS